jgi:hypothetical protein
MLFDILFAAACNKIEKYMQCQTNLENNIHVNYDYKVGKKVLVSQDGIIRKAETSCCKKPWTTWQFIQMHQDSMQDKIGKT